MKICISLLLTVCLLFCVLALPSWPEEIFPGDPSVTLSDSGMEYALGGHALAPRPNLSLPGFLAASWEKTWCGPDSFPASPYRRGPPFGIL